MRNHIKLVTSKEIVFNVLKIQFQPINNIQTRVFMYEMYLFYTSLEHVLLYFNVKRLRAIQVEYGATKILLLLLLLLLLLYSTFQHINKHVANLVN